MPPRAATVSLFALAWTTAVTAVAQVPVLPPGDKEPVLRLEAGGPTSYVTALTFNRDGSRLYSAGFDKVVRVWERDQRGQYRPLPMSFRVPLGPGLNGAINALALSPDGKWLATGGQGVYRGLPGFREFGYLVPLAGTFTDTMRQDQGLIHVFNTDDGSVRLLRGQRGPLFALAFAPARPGKPPLLASLAFESGGQAQVKGELRL